MRIDGELTPELKGVIQDRFEGFELVEFLNIDIETIIDLLHDHIVDNLEDVLEELELNEDSNDED